MLERLVEFDQHPTRPQKTKVIRKQELVYTPVNWRKHDKKIEYSPTTVPIAGQKERASLRRIFECRRDIYHEELVKGYEDQDRKEVEYSEYILTAIDSGSLTINLTADQTEWIDSALDVERQSVQDIREEYEKEGDSDKVEFWNWRIEMVNYFLKVIKDSSISRNRPIISQDHKCSGEESEKFTPYNEYPLGTHFCGGCGGVYEPLPRSWGICMTCREPNIFPEEFLQHCKQKHPDKIEGVMADIDMSENIDGMFCIKCGESVGSIEGFRQHAALKHPGEEDI